MDENHEELAARYEAAMRRFRKHLKRAKDGTFVLDIASGESIDVDPVTFADMKRSLEETNRKIKSGMIKSGAVEGP